MLVLKRLLLCGAQFTLLHSPFFKYASIIQIMTEPIPQNPPASVSCWSLKSLCGVNWNYTFIIKCRFCAQFFYTVRQSGSIRTLDLVCSIASSKKTCLCYRINHSCFQSDTVVNHSNANKIFSAIEHHNNKHICGWMDFVKAFKKIWGETIFFWVVAAHIIWTWMLKCVTLLPSPMRTCFWYRFVSACMSFWLVNTIAQKAVDEFW